ncbi:MAG: hypothetical protein GX638_14020 [Crenarchaeota archaeon]|nr:hypothetical protein [Thermoproteota archaeon]
MEKSLKSFQFKQRVVLSFDTLNKINFYKQSIQNEVKNVRDDLNIVISPILRTYNDDKNEKLENKEDQIKKNNYTDIICECKRHESKKYLIKGEVDFMKQNFRKYENHMICNECIHKMHYDGLSINRFLEIHASL